MLEFIIENKIYVTYIFELIAAVSGSYYLFKTPSARSTIRYFAGFLWFVLILDLSGLYALWAFFDDYKTFPFLENSLFTRNVWLYNWFHLISITFYSFLFIKQVTRIKYRKILKFSLFIYILLGIFKLTSSNQLFYSYDMAILFVGVLLLTISISCYYFELLISDDLLDLKKNLLFYISLGLLIWHLCVLPIEIYSVYFSVKNIDFITVYSAIKRYSNIFMYSLFSFAFIYCAQKKQLPEFAKNKSA